MQPACTCKLLVISPLTMPRRSATAIGPSYRRGFRALPVLLALVCLSGQLASMSHGLHGSHGECSSHGDTHGSEGSGVEESHGTAGTAHLDLPAVRSSEPLNRGDASGCLLCWAVGQSAAAAQVTSVGIRPVVVRLSEVMGPASAQGRSSIYGFAPKTSPPA